MNKRREQLTAESMRQLAYHQERELKDCLGKWVSELEPVMIFKGLRFCGIGIATGMGQKCKIVIRVPKRTKTYAPGRFIDVSACIDALQDDDDA